MSLSGRSIARVAKNVHIYRATGADRSLTVIASDDLLALQLRRAVLLNSVGADSMLISEIESDIFGTTHRFTTRLRNTDVTSDGYITTSLGVTNGND